jgi:hypothetical protein
MFSIEQRVKMLGEVAERYQGKPFDLGSDDCVHMITFGLKQLGLKVSLMKHGSYNTPAGARRALKKAGFNSLLEAVPAQGFVEIAPSMAWPGDIIAMKAKDDEDVALAFMGSNGRAFGFWNDHAQYFQPLAFEAAWRVG